MNIVLIILIFGAFIAFSLDRKKGIYFVIIAGFLQDPIRKLIENTPAVLTLLSTVVLSCVYMKARLIRYGGVSILSLYPQLRRPLHLFMFVVIVQALNAYINTSSITISIIGLVAYLSPVPAIMLSYQSVRSYRDIRKLLSFYIVAAVLFISSLWVEWYGFESKLLGTFGIAWFAYYEGGALQLLSGLFRSPEIAAWHGATAGILAFSLSFEKDNRVDWKKFLFFLVCFITLFLTGRRKGVGTIFIFGGVYLLFLVQKNFKGRRRALVSLIMVVVVIAGMFNLSKVKPDEGNFSPYVYRGKSTFEDSPSRIGNVYDNIAYTWSGAGIIGLGAGYFSQGSQHITDIETRTAKYTEVGLAKILGELGLPGLLIFVWLVVVWYKSLRKEYRKFSSNELRVYSIIIISLLIAQAVSFFFAAQAFGDPFILTVLGFAVGILMALPKIEMHTAASPPRQHALFKSYVKR